MKTVLVGLLLSVAMVAAAQDQVIINVRSLSQRSGTAKITAYKYNPDLSVNTDVKVHYKIVSTNQGKVFDSYLLEPFYGVGFIWIVDVKFNADQLLYASNTDTDFVTIYVEYFDGDGHSIYTAAQTLLPKQQTSFSAAQWVCPQNNPGAQHMGPC